MRYAHTEHARAEAPRRAADALLELPDPTADVGPLVRWCEGRRVVVLAGAGCSTESGIPDYRGPIGAKRERTPILYRQFVRSEEMRKRYWARSAIGWPVMRATAAASSEAVGVAAVAR